MKRKSHSTSLMKVLWIIDNGRSTEGRRDCWEAYCIGRAGLFITRLLLSWSLSWPNFKFNHRIFMQMIVFKLLSSYELLIKLLSWLKLVGLEILANLIGGIKIVVFLMRQIRLLKFAGMFKDWMTQFVFVCIIKMTETIAGVQWNNNACLIKNYSNKFSCTTPDKGNKCFWNECYFDVEELCDSINKWVAYRLFNSLLVL